MLCGGDCGACGDFPEPDDQGLSLDELGQAYAALLAKGTDPYPQAGDEPAAEAPPKDEQTAEEPLPVIRGQDEEACEITPQTILEAMLFVGHPTGEPLASLFEGGVREAVLTSVADVCARGTSGRFRVKHGGIGYAGLASPIVAADARVGVLIVFSESAPDDERVHRLQRELGRPLEELARAHEELAALPGVARDAKARAPLEALGRAVEQLRVVLAG